MFRTLVVLLPVAIMFAIGTIILLSDRRPHLETADPPREVLTTPGRVADRDALATGVASRPTLVGRQVCGECHAENFALHSKHGHASTFHLVSQTDLARTLAGSRFDGGEGYGEYHYSRDGDGNLLVTLPDQFGDEPFPLQYVLGSGLHAQSFLTLAPDEQAPDEQAPDEQVSDETPGGGAGPVRQANVGTQGIEHRVSCYPGGRLGLTPGHADKQPRSGLEYFGDSFRGTPLRRCVYCHTTDAQIVGHQIENLIANVNCEKCHGPGSEHVRLARAGPNPPPYSVGRESWDAESEIQLCGDCHRLPKSVSVKELREYPDLLARFQPIGLLRSRCYLESSNSLRCTTCHNTHRSVRATDRAKQIENCIHCHRPETEAHVSCPVSPESGCIECHMPAIEFEQGLSFHDHWIRVRRE